MVDMEVLEDIKDMEDMGYMVDMEAITVGMEDLEGLLLLPGWDLLISSITYFTPPGEQLGSSGGSLN